MRLKCFLVRGSGLPGPEALLFHLVFRMAYELRAILLNHKYRNLIIFITSINTNSQVTITLWESQPLMYSPPSRIRKRFIPLLFLIQYTSANDSGSHAVKQENGLASSLANSDSALLAISDPLRFATPFTSSSASDYTATDPSEDSQDSNDIEPFLLSSEPCNSPTDQPYSSRRRRKRQTKKTFCDNPNAGTPLQLQNNNENTKPNSPARNQVPKPNERDQNPPSSDSTESFQSLLYAVPGLDGKLDPSACKNPEYPLFQIPICAFITGYLRSSPTNIVVPCKFSKFLPTTSSLLLNLKCDSAVRRVR